MHIQNKKQKLWKWNDITKTIKKRICYFFLILSMHSVSINMKVLNNYLYPFCSWLLYVTILNLEMMYVQCHQKKKKTSSALLCFEKQKLGWKKKCLSFSLLWIPILACYFVDCTASERAHLDPICCCGCSSVRVVVKSF